ncbi:PGAP1-like protein-domain-containing protein [Aspergillus terreus]|uniref:PGAP1-like protein-domain-containing protein n=1 Tax=Aspergillus terreus TaxID=33178 RepID=A0A5M3ZDM2_ASPTE|nr:hypothetical protein ATETN484_0017002300 [Aspergillus terreus]GFF21701.1 PGAP1-like protein-domain-containing protein [Aspergillus terreus]
MDPSTVSFQVNRLGLTLLHPRSNDANSLAAPTVNIVFVHGLRGHPRKTWEYVTPVQRAVTRSAGAVPAKKKNWFNKLKLESSLRSTVAGPHLRLADTNGPMDGYENVYWPADLLPSVVPNARIWAYGYNADIIGGLFQSNNKNSILQHGNDFMVKAERILKGDLPIIFVAHSLGGLVVKVAMYRMWSSVDSRYQRFFRRIRAVVFCGTPHRGSNAAAWGTLAANLIAMAFVDSNSRLLSDLRIDSEVLDRTQEDFLKALHRASIRIHSFQEGRALSGMKGLSDKVVDDFSSKLGLPEETVETTDADHREMIREPGVKDISDVLKELEQMAVGAGQAVEVGELSLLTSVIVSNNTG